MIRGGLSDPLWSSSSRNMSKHSMSEIKVLKEKAKKERHRKAAAQATSQVYKRLDDMVFNLEPRQSNDETFLSNTIKHVLGDYAIFAKALERKESTQYLGLDNTIPGTPEVKDVDFDNPINTFINKANKKNTTKKYLENRKSGKEFLEPTSKPNADHKGQLLEKSRPPKLKMPAKEGEVKTPNKIESILKEMTQGLPPSLTDIQTPRKVTEKEFFSKAVAKNQTELTNQLSVESKASCQVVEKSENLGNCTNNRSRLKIGKNISGISDGVDNAVHTDTNDRLFNRQLSVSSSSSSDGSSSDSSSDSEEEEDNEKDLRQINKLSELKPISVNSPLLAANSPLNNNYLVDKSVLLIPAPNSSASQEVKNNAKTDSMDQSQNILLDGEQESFDSLLNVDNKQLANIRNTLTSNFPDSNPMNLFRMEKTVSPLNDGLFDDLDFSGHRDDFMGEDLLIPASGIHTSSSQESLTTTVFNDTNMIPLPSSCVNIPLFEDVHTDPLLCSLDNTLTLTEKTRDQPVAAAPNLRNSEVHVSRQIPLIPPKNPGYRKDARGKEVVHNISDEHNKFASKSNETKDKNKSKTTRIAGKQSLRKPTTLLTTLSTKAKKRTFKKISSDRESNFRQNAKPSQSENSVTNFCHSSPTQHTLQIFEATDNCLNPKNNACMSIVKTNLQLNLSPLSEVDHPSNEKTMKDVNEPKIKPGPVSPLLKKEFSLKSLGTFSKNTGLEDLSPTTTNPNKLTVKISLKKIKLKDSSVKSKAVKPVNKRRRSIAALDNCMSPALDEDIKHHMSPRKRKLTELKKNTIARSDDSDSSSSESEDSKDVFKSPNNLNFDELLVKINLSRLKRHPWEKPYDVLTTPKKIRLEESDKKTELKRCSRMPRFDATDIPQLSNDDKRSLISSERDESSEDVEAHRGSSSEKQRKKRGRPPKEKLSKCDIKAEGDNMKFIEETTILIDPNACQNCGTLRKDSGKDEEKISGYKKSYGGYLEEGKQRKHKADCLQDPINKRQTYLDAVLYYVKYLVGLELSRKLVTKQGLEEHMKIGTECIRLIDYVITHYSRKTAKNYDHRFLFLCFRLQSMLYLKLFELKKNSAMKSTKILSEYYKQYKPTKSNVSCLNASASRGNTETPSPLSPSSGPSPGGSVGSVGSAGSSGSIGDKNMVSIPVDMHERSFQILQYTKYLLHAHKLWEESDMLLPHCQEFLNSLLRKAGLMSLQSSMLQVIDYISAGLQIIINNPHS